MAAKRKYTKNLPAVKKSYYRWVKMRQHFVPPFNKVEFSRMKGVPISTLTSWDKAMKDEEMLRKPGTDDVVIDDEVSVFIDRIYQLAMEGKGAKYAEIYAKMKGILTDKREDTLKVEFTPKDRIRIAREVIAGLRAEYQTRGGSCPICGEHKALRNGARLDSEPRDSEGREMATVALPT